MNVRFRHAATALGSSALLILPMLAAAALASAITPGSAAAQSAATRDASAGISVSSLDRPTPAASTSIAPPDPNRPLLVNAPSPEQRQAPAAIVSPVAGEVSVELVNTTYADVNYQLLGHTQVRTLPGRSTVTLRGADVPTTLTFQRQDSGLLAVTPRDPEDGGTLSLTLDETLDFEQSKVVMTIEPSGKVFLN